MKNENILLVFFGSGPVAAESLRQLAELFSIEAVITKPTTEREMRQACPDAPQHIVSNKSELDDLMSKVNFRSSVGVLIDFGIIVSDKVIDSFENGIINSHFSLLPEWRGADPITFSILSGQKRTGVSLMLLVEAMDEGPILSTGVYNLSGSETTPQLTTELTSLSTSLLQKNLPEYLNGSIKPQAQVDVAQSIGMSAQATYSRKLTKEDGRIDWDKSAIDLEREIRAFAGWPKSYTRLGEIDVTITKAHVSNKHDSNDTPGKITKDENSIMVSCSTGNLHIKKLKPAGKKEMDAKAFLAGYASRIGL